MRNIASNLRRIRYFAARFAVADEGATTIEYSVLSGGIALVILMVIGAVGDATLAKYTSMLAAIVHP